MMAIYKYEFGPNWDKKMHQYLQDGTFECMAILDGKNWEKRLKDWFSKASDSTLPSIFIRNRDLVWLD